MKILMTGASGFIGSHLLPILSSSHEVHSLSSDLLNFSEVQQEVKSCNPDLVIHLAARTEVERSFYEPMVFSQVNYDGSINLIEACKKLPKLRNFLFASTMEVYGWQPISDEVQHTGSFAQSIAFDEHTNPNPNAPYAVAKLGVEKYLEYMHRSQGFPFTSLRQTNAYGRKDNDFFVTEQIITQMLKSPSDVYLGYEKPFRNFIYVDDLISAWVSLVEHTDSVNKGMIFTIGPDRPIQIHAWADIIAKKLNWHGQIHWNSKPARPGEIYWLNSGNKLIQQYTGWQPLVGYDQGLDNTIDIWKQNLEII
jgi:nucleoside-diphosphate-sugar epimerase